MLINGYVIAGVAYVGNSGASDSKWYCASRVVRWIGPTSPNIIVIAQVNALCAASGVSVTEHKYGISTIWPS